MIEWVLDSIVALNLRHSEFLWQGTGIDGYSERESVLFTKSSRSLETRPLRAFIMTSICSFITCISARMGGGAVSMREGMLRFRRFDLLGSLLPFGLSGPFVRSYPPGFPPGCQVPCPSDAVAPPDHDSVS